MQRIKKQYLVVLFRKLTRQKIEQSSSFQKKGG